jgi:hypothetical protein
VNGLAPAGIGAAVLDTPTAFPATEEGILAPMEEQSNMVVVEVFYYYRPILRALLQGVGNASSGAAGFSFFLDDRIYIKRTYFAPRRGDMFHLPPTFPAP